MAEPVRDVVPVDLDGERLSARAHGEPVDVGRHHPAVEVKGATMTGLRVAQEPDGAKTLIDGHVVERLSADVSRAFEQLAHSASAIQQLARVDYVTLNASTAFNNYWMLPRLPALQSLHPEIDLRLRKPHPRLFETACRLAAVQPAQLAHVGDEPGSETLHLASLSPGTGPVRGRCRPSSTVLRAASIWPGYLGRPRGSLLKSRMSVAPRSLASSAIWGRSR